MALEDGIGGGWHFNTGATDFSGNGNDGTVVGATLDTINQKLGAGCFSFAIDDYIWMADAPTLNPGSGDFSAVGWINTIAVARQAIARKTNTGAVGWFAEINQAVGDGKLFFSVYDGSAFRQYKTTAIINGGSFLSWGATWENATQTLLLYVSGIEGHTPSFVSGTVGDIDVSDRLEIGRDNAAGGRRFYTGLLDETLFYPGIVLSAADMLAFDNGGEGIEVGVEVAEATKDGVPTIIHRGAIATKTVQPQGTSRIIQPPIGSKIIHRK